MIGAITGVGEIAGDQSNESACPICPPAMKTNVDSGRNVDSVRKRVSWADVARSGTSKQSMASWPTVRVPM